MRSEEEMIAYALETETQLLPFLPELLTDLDELGGDAELIVDVIRDLELPDLATVIDLGSGKGAVAVEIADELGLHVLGIDLFAPFLDSSVALAQRTGVADLCEFRRGDIVKLAREVEPADVVVFASLGDVLGTLEETVGLIRSYARPGGYILIHDVYVKKGGSNSFPGFEQYVDHATTRQRLTACGDELVREVLEEVPDGADDEDAEGDLIMRRADALAHRYPDHAPGLLGFARDQQRELAFIEENLQGAVWVLRRN